MALNGGKHVMLSYNHKSKSVVQLVYNTLFAEDIPVWFDDRDMDDNMYDSMAEAVNNAAVVCCFMTPEYEDSKNCKLELQHAQTLGKRILPCMVTNRKLWKPSPDKWLGLITGSILAIDFSDTSETNVVLKCRELIDRIPITNGSHTSLFETLRRKYLRESAIKRLVNEEKCFPIENSYINLAIVEAKEQKEKENKLKQQDQFSKDFDSSILSTYEEIYDVKTSIDVKDIFKQCKGTKKTVLLIGRAGIGKSTFCQYVAYQWAKRNFWHEYELAVLVYLRRLTDDRYPKGKEYAPIDILKKEYFPYDDISDEEKKNFNQLCKSGKILWILDGYDEFAQNIPPQLKDLFDHLHETQHHILTSRPYAVALPYEVKLEIVGFTADNIAKYVELFFDQIKENRPNRLMEKKKILHFLKSNPSIWGVAHIPVNLELICSLWSNTDWSKTKILTLTVLYDNMVEWLCRRYLIKQNDHYENLVDMEKEDVYKECEPYLKFLEHLAFKAIESQSILLPPELLKETKDELKFCKEKYRSILNFGILKSHDENTMGEHNPTKQQHYFVHLSFQEHFAARHLRNLLKSPNKWEAINFINKNKYNQRCRLVFIFTSGLLLERKNQSAMHVFWTTIQNEPLDLVGLQHIKLIIEIVNEVLQQNVFRERTTYLKSIAQWIVASATHPAVAVRNALTRSLQRAPAVVNTTFVQQIFLRLLSMRDHNIKLNTLEMIVTSKISAPFKELTTSLLNALCHEKSSIARAAREALKNIDEKAATYDVIAALVNAIHNEESDVRSEACEALGKMGKNAVTDEVISALTNAISDEESCVRRAACEAFVKMGEKAVTDGVIEALLHATHDKEWHVRRAACQALGKITRNTATDDVITALLNAVYDEESSVQIAACYALREMGEKAATEDVITALLNAIHDKQWYLRRTACQALTNMGEKVAFSSVIKALLSAMRDEHKDVRRAACETIVKIDEKTTNNHVIAVLLDAINDEKSYIQRAACEAIGNMGEKAATNDVIEALLTAMRDEQRDVRTAAYEAVIKMGENAMINHVIPVLLNAMHNEESYIRSTACEALGAMGEKVASDDVIITLLNALHDKEWYVRYAACYALGNMGEKATNNDVLPALLDAMHDEQSDVRSAACYALGNISEKSITNDVVSALLNAICDEGSCVRRAACEAIVKMGEKAATNDMIDALLDATHDKVWHVRRVACEALGKMDQSTVTVDMITALLNATYDEESSVRNAAYYAIREIGEKAATDDVIAVLLNGIHDEEPDIRVVACEALGNMGEKVASNDVIKALLNTMRNEKPNVRRAACEAVIKMGDKVVTSDVIDGLLHSMCGLNSNVERAVCKMLVEMSKRALTYDLVDILLNAVHGQNKNVRRTACLVLQMMGENAATNDVIARLIDIPSISGVDEQDDLVETVEIVCSNKGISNWNSDVISAVFQRLKQNKWIKFANMRPNHLMNTYFDSGDDNWLGLVAYVGLVQRIAVTIMGNTITIYYANEVIELCVRHSDLMNRLLEMFKEQKEKLEKMISILPQLESDAVEEIAD